MAMQLIPMSFEDRVKALEPLEPGKVVQFFGSEMHIIKRDPGNARFMLERPKLPKRHVYTQSLLDIFKRGSFIESDGLAMLVGGVNHTRLTLYPIGVYQDIPESEESNKELENVT